MLRSRAFDPGYRQRLRVKKQEKALAKSLGGKRAPGSGGLRQSRWTTFGRGGGVPDVRAAGTSAEAKLTVKSSITIKLSWLEAITKAAILKNRVPLVQLLIDASSQSSQLVPKEWAVIPWAEYLRLRERPAEVPEI